MILVDTSVWIDHFRRSIPELVRHLEDGSVACHPFIVGELALGTLRNRVETVELLAELPALDLSSHDDVLLFADRHDLHGRGIGWIDAHLLCATAAADLRIWTHDKKLRACAAKLGLAR